MKAAWKVAVVAGILGNAAIAFAEPSCTGWMKQEDGSEWRTCVGDDGKQYCEQRKGDTITRVACK